jgi:NADH-quinone oxidoreductase subunit K
MILDLFHSLGYASTFSSAIITLGIYFSFILFFIGILAIILDGNNLIMLIIALELLLLSIGLMFALYSFILDDFIGVSLTFYLLPLAGAESAILLSVILRFYPKRGTLTLGEF